MDFFSMLLLIAFGGSCGGIASGIAQNNLNNSYEIRLPFLFNKDTKEARLLPLGILGNIIIGAAASTSIFFVAGSLFNLEPSTSRLQGQNNSIPQERKLPTIFNTAELLNLPEERATDYAKMFSISVAAGFAGISLMEGMAKRVTNTLVSDKQRTSDEAVKVEKEAKLDGTTKTTVTKLSQEKEKSHKVLNPALTDAPLDADRLDENAENNNDSSNKISHQEAFKQLDSLDAEKLLQPLNNSTTASAKVNKDK